MANIQISDLSDGSVDNTDIIHINETGLDRKVTVGNLATHIEGELSHDNISGSGTNTHAQVDTHLADDSKHRVINDSGSSNTELWSADKIISYSAAQTHDTSSLVSGTLADARVAESNVTQHETAINHDNLSGFVADEHIDWKVDAGANNINDANIQLSGVTQHQASIDHDVLTNFSANEHVDHSSVVLTAGVGLTGGGDTTASRIIDFDASTLTPITVPATADVIPLYDDGVGQRSISFGNLEANLDLTNLTGYVAGEHILHSGVSITAGEGLSGGGDISASRTIDVDINGLTEDLTPDDATDFVITYDASAGVHKKVRMDNLTVTSETNVNNDGVNVGVAGVDVFKQMNGTDLEFRSINSSSNRLSVTLDAANNEVDLDVVPGNIDISNLLNAGSIATQEASNVTITGGAITNTTIDSRDLSVDGAKLDGIEANATADQTKADIDALGIDAATVDGLDSSQFVRSDAADTKTAGNFIFNDNVKISLGTLGAEADLYSDGVNSLLDLLSGNFIVRDGATTRFTFDRTTGDFTATGNVTAYSDINLKDNISLIENALYKVNSLNGYTFDRTDIAASRQAGVIAQEVEEVLPEVVSTDKDGIKSVAYGNMVSVLIEAIKELSKKVEELETGVLSDKRLKVDK